MLPQRGHSGWMEAAFGVALGYAEVRSAGEMVVVVKVRPDMQIGKVAAAAVGTNSPDSKLQSVV